MSVKFQQGIREYNGSLDKCWSHCIDGSVYKGNVKVFPSESERLEATKNMSPDEVDEYYKCIRNNQHDIFRNLTDEESEIYDEKLDQESIETGVKLF